MKKLFFAIIFLFLFLPFNNYAQTEGDYFWNGVLSSSENENMVLANVRDTLYSINGGYWTKIGYLESDYLFDLQIDTINRIWAVYFDKILFSSDFGLTWKQIPRPAQGYIGKAEISGNFIFIWSNFKVLRKDYTDNESNWVQVLGEGGYVENFACGPDQKLFASIYPFQILKSADNGESWVQMNYPENCNSTIGTLNFRDERLFVGSYFNGVFYSDDLGDTWNKSLGFPSQAGVTLVKKFGNIVLALGRDQIRTHGIFYSTDNGANFLRMNTGLSHWAEEFIRVFTKMEHTIFFNAGHRGFFMTNNFGATVDDINNGFDNLKPHDVSRVCMDDQGAIWTIMVEPSGGPRNTWGVYKTDNSGQLWSDVSWGLYDEYMTLLDLEVTPNGTAFASSYNRNLFRSTDGGLNWDLLPGLRAGVEVIKMLNNDTIFAGTYSDGLFRTTDGGNLWERLANGTPTQYPSRVSDIFIYENQVFAIFSGQLFISLDYGESWSVTSSQIITKIVKEGPYLFGAHNNYIYRSSNNGATWENFSTNLPSNSYVFSMIIVTDYTPIPQKNIVLATNNGVYKSDINNCNFIKISDSVANYLLLNNQTGELIMGTKNGVLFEPAFIPSSVQNFDFSEKLHVYPNPATSKLFIELLNNEFIKTIELINISGSVVGIFTPNHVSNLTLDVSGLKKGLHIIRVHTGSNIYVKKIMLL